MRMRVFASSAEQAADYFFVPAYGGCFISEFNRPYPRHWLCDRCHEGKAADLASLRAMRWHEALLDYIRGTYPHWNASGGSDHLWPLTHDEGACYAPAALRRATLLTHWGRDETRPNGSSEYHLWRVKPHARRMYGWQRCYDPCKDVVLPSWKRPEAFRDSPFMRAHVGAEEDGGARERDVLFYFNGVLGTTQLLQNYSFGLRQQLHALFGHLAQKGSVLVTDKKTSRYSEMLSRSKFCGVLPGWGWSGRMEDAVLHGCIPVLLQDRIHAPWETVLDWQSYALRVPRRQMPRLLETLGQLPSERVRRMQQALRAVWPRFTYLSVVKAEHARTRAPAAPLPTVVAGLAGRDAVATLLQLLEARLRLRRARRDARRISAEPHLAPAPACTIDDFGNDIGQEVRTLEGTGFQERSVNGWVI